MRSDQGGGRVLAGESLLRSRPSFASSTLRPAALALHAGVREAEQKGRYCLDSGFVPSSQSCLYLARYIQFFCIIEKILHSDGFINRTNKAGNLYFVLDTKRKTIFTIILFHFHNVIFFLWSKFVGMFSTLKKIVNGMIASNRIVARNKSTSNRSLIRIFQWLIFIYQHIFLMALSYLFCANFCNKERHKNALFNNTFAALNFINHHRWFSLTSHLLSSVKLLLDAFLLGLWKHGTCDHLYLIIFELLSPTKTLQR